MRLIIDGVLDRRLPWLLIGLGAPVAASGAVLFGLRRQAAGKRTQEGPASG